MRKTLVTKLLHGDICMPVSFKNASLAAVGARTLSSLTKLDEQHARRGHGALGVGGHTLEVARVSSVQVADAEA